MKSKNTISIKKAITKACAVCGRRMRIVLYNDGFYRNGHFFKTMKIPIGKGEYKKVGTSKMGGKKVDIVKWTGKEKTIEYWECNDCFSEAQQECWLEEILKKLYGEKCKDFEKGCACCQAWNTYDTILDNNRGRL